MATVFKYKYYCETCGQFVYDWNEEPPTTCPISYGHTINAASMSIVDKVSENLMQLDIQKGTQDTLCFLDMASNYTYLEIEALAGYKFKVDYICLTFHEDLVDENAYVFEFHRKMDLADPTNPEAANRDYVCVSQIYYPSIWEMLAVAPKVEYLGGIYRVFFEWGSVNQQDGREPLYVESKWNDKLVAYPTKDAEHKGAWNTAQASNIGTDPTDFYEWYGGMVGYPSFRIFHPYTKFTPTEYTTYAPTFDNTPHKRHIFSVSVRGARFLQD